ncbi:class I SAM-dependent methyltransferase [Microgenomates group bacterium]|nr:class I SAM-dependent methyltransferase [Microgenomates group bacterium]
MKLYSQAWFNYYYKNRNWQSYSGIIKLLEAYIVEPILDIGCGLGFTIEAFTRAGYRAIGIDNSPAALKQAKSRNRSLKFIRADLSKTWPVKTKSIGTLICSQTIEHLPENKQNFLIKEAYRVLKPKGILWIDTPSWWNKEERLEASHTHLFTPKELIKLLKANRFQIIQSLCASREWAKILYFYTKWDILSQTASFICQKNE